MKPIIKVSFSLESRNADFSEIDNLLQIKPSKYREIFPPNSIAVPFWETEVVDNSFEVEEVVQTLLNRIQPKANMIKELCCRFHMTSTLVIRITAKYENGPFISLSASQLTFLSALGSQLIVDLEGLYPDEEGVHHEMNLC